MAEYERIDQPGLRSGTVPRWCVTHGAIHQEYEGPPADDCVIRDLYIEKGCAAQWTIDPIDGGHDRQVVTCARQIYPHDTHEGEYRPEDNGGYGRLVFVRVRWTD